MAFLELINMHIQSHSYIVNERQKLKKKKNVTLDKLNRSTHKTKRRRVEEAAVCLANASTRRASVVGMQLLHCGFQSFVLLSASLAIRQQIISARIFHSFAEVTECEQLNATKYAQRIDFQRTVRA